MTSERDHAPDRPADLDADEVEELAGTASAYGVPDRDQPEPGPPPSAGGTDLPGPAQADLTGDEPEVRKENQPPPRGMQVPRGD